MQMAVLFHFQGVALEVEGSTSSSTSSRGSGVWIAEGWMPDHVFIDFRTRHPGVDHRYTSRYGMISQHIVTCHSACIVKRKLI